MSRAGAVVVAGGQGTRLGGPVRKQYLEVAGVPVLLRALRPFLDHPAVDEVVLVLPSDDAGAPPPWLRGLAVQVVAGGAERGDSVWNGLQALSGRCQVVLVHDGARPFVDGGLIGRVLAAAPAIAAVPVTDTIQEVDGEGCIVGTPDRSRLWRAQTPQAFPLAELRDAYARARGEGFSGTDDAAVFRRHGGTVRVVAGSERNMKVTHPVDLFLAERLALAGA